MVSGFALGGAWDGINQATQNATQQQQVDQQGSFNRKKLEIEAQAQQAAQKRQEQARNDQLLADARAKVTDSILNMRLAGVPEDKIMKTIAPAKEQLGVFAKKLGQDPVMSIEIPFTSAFTKDISDELQKRQKTGAEIDHLRQETAKPFIIGENEDDLLGTKTKQYGVYDPSSRSAVPIRSMSQNLTSPGTQITGASVQDIGPDGKPTGAQQPIDVSGGQQQKVDAGLPAAPDTADIKNVMPTNPLGVPPTKNPTIQKLAARGIIDENTFDYRALRLLGGDKSQVQGSGYGRIGPIIRNALQTRAAELGMDMGITPGEANARVAGYTANTQALKTLVGQKNAIEAFSNNELKNLDVLVDISKKVDKTGVPVLQRWINAGRKSIQGDPDVAEYDFQMQLVRNGAARIISNPNMSGVVTVDQVNELRDGLPNASSYAQVKRIAERAKADFKNRHDSIDEQISKVNKSFGNLAKSSAGPDKAAKDNGGLPSDWSTYVHGKY